MWGGPLQKALNAAGPVAKEAARRAMQSMAEAAVAGAKAAKRKTVELATKGVDAIKSAKTKAVDTFHSIKESYSLKRSSRVPATQCPMVNKTLGDLDCPGLAKEHDYFSQTRTKGKLADAAYQEPGKQNLPEGWKPASDEDLKELGLMDKSGRKLTEIPDSDFLANVFKGPNGEYVVAFKGTSPTSGEDWKNNAQQGRGNEAEYYSTAKMISKRVETTSPGKVSYVGHSLGGGLASAAAATGNAHATTFNAAGLHNKTIDGTPAPDKVDAIYVEGDILSSVQDKVSLTPSAAGKRVALSPANSVTMSDVAVGLVSSALLTPLYGAVIGAGARGVRLHGMGEVDASLAKRIDHIEQVQKAKGCTP